ncbi:hypothetical protein [Ligilactobacillus equi]|uniref:Uncharacterized protein n=1 Tax=Ligilactobacillus equi DPC 6820 TaxID=1392007 RepID=V7HYR6_9LACO|nr:hypothetical protein [Ligilactobacillus equi]ETA75027.1 hypothetical protein LEQ_1442c [Ligilactobacillus equi DPC 6820]
MEDKLIAVIVEENAEEAIPNKYILLNKLKWQITIIERENLQWQIMEVCGSMILLFMMVF